MRSVAIVLIALFAVGASALSVDVHAAAKIRAMGAQVRALRPSLRSVGASSTSAHGKFSVMAREYGNPCTTGTAAACQLASRTDEGGCGYGSQCVGSSRSTGSCTFLTGGLSCGSTCTVFNSTSNTYPAATQCPAATTCAVTGSTGTAYTCGFGGATKFAVVGCSCTTTEDCQSPATCQSGSCSLVGQSAFPTGASCNNINDCASGTCTNNACGPKTACASNDDCAVDKVCNKTSTACVDPIPIGGACWNDEDGQATTECAGFGSCLGEASSAGVCANFFSVAEGGRCYQNPAWCAPGLSCDINNVNGTCFSGAGVCGNVAGPFTCPVGQHCGCSGSTPSCTGPTVSQSCVDKLRAAASACRGGPHDVKATPQNYNSAAATAACISAQADFYCNRDCAGPDSAFGRGSVLDITSNLDYRQFSCKNRAIIAYTASQNFGCTRTYCPEGFNSAASASASIVIVLLAIISAVLAAPSN